MTSTENQVYLVTGGNRGLGLGLVKALLARPATTVIASVRNEEAAASLQTEIKAVSAGSQSIFHIIQLDFSTAIPPEKIREVLNTTIPTIKHIDILICNAGYVAPMVPATETIAGDLRSSFEVNTIAPLLVFQAFWPLLQRSPTTTPKIIMLSSSVGSIANQEPIPCGAYGTSRAAGNWLTRALHVQNENLVAVALHPGWVHTRARNFAAEQWGYAPGPPDNVDDSVRGMLEVIDGATRETVSGRFVTNTGDELPW